MFGNITLFVTGYEIVIYAMSCKMSVFVALDMTIGPRVSCTKK
jgi:hypothetical protein